MWLQSFLTTLFLSHFTLALDNKTYKVAIIEHQNSLLIEINRYLRKLDPSHKIDVLRIQDIPNEMTFDALKNASKLLDDKDISALIGPYSEIFMHVTAFHRIPYIVTSVIPYHVGDNPFLLKIVPGIDIYSKAINDVVTHFKWQKVGLVYDTEESHYIVSQLVDGEHTDLRAYNIRNNNSAAHVRWALRDIRNKFIEKFIVICSSKNADIVLTQALYLSLLSRPNEWLIVNVGDDTVALDEYSDSRANLTSLLIMFDKSPENCALEKAEMSLSNAIIHDALKVYVDIINRHVNLTRLQMRKTLRQIRLDGCTGQLRFSKMGVRNETFLQMATLATKKDGTSHLFQYGTWRSGKSRLKERIKPSSSYNLVMRMNDDILWGSRLRVTTKLEAPFVQFKKNGTKDKNAPDLEGHLIDILDELAKQLDFTYNISIVADGKYGSYKGPPRGWTGMVRVLKDDKADIALAPFQITPSRSEVVDFTKPFMTKGTSMVVQKPKRSVSPFQFLMPLSRDVWISIFAAYVFTSLVLFGVSRINCDRHEHFTENIRFSFWYIWGTLLRGNLTQSPTGISSRIISSTWWFFSLIVISVYTANLAAFLTITNAHIGIQSATDLPKQKEYNYGTVEGSQIQNFFEGSDLPDYEKMWAHMTITAGAIVRRVEDGFEKVKNEKYVFLWDSPVIRHQITNNCDMMEIGSPFDLKGYGIATRKHSPITEHLSMVILKMSENGMLYSLEKKWFGRLSCPDSRADAKSQKIKISVAAGMFYVLAAGIGLAAIVFCFQLIIKNHCSKKRRSPEKIEENNTANHVERNIPLENDKEEEFITVLSRTLSIGENSVSDRWNREPF